MDNVLFHSLYTLFLIIITWFLISIPVWVASKIVSRKGSLGRAMIATLVSIIVFLVLFGVLSPINKIFASLIALIGILAVYKSVFEVGWLGAFLITIISFLILIAMSLIAGLSLLLFF